MFNKNKEAAATLTINLANRISIKGYVPSYALGAMEVIGVDCLNVGYVNGARMTRAVRAGIATAQVNDPDVASLLGDTVILLDKKLISASKNPFIRKEVLALIAAENARVFGQGGITAIEDGVSIPDRAWALEFAGRIYGYRVARNGLNRQAKILDKSMKPLIREVHKDFKKACKAAAKGMVEAEKVADATAQPAGANV